MEFSKDYDFVLIYHRSDKASVVVDALSRNSLHTSALMVKKMDLIEHVKDLNLVCELTPKYMKLGMLKITQRESLNSSRKMLLELAQEKTSTIVEKSQEKVYLNKVRGRNSMLRLVGFSLNPKFI